MTNTIIIQTKKTCNKIFQIEERLNQLKSVPIGGTGKTHKWSWQIEEEKRQKEEKIRKEEKNKKK